VESQKDPKNDPVALWTNGGPGCSGLEGLLTEQGPFRAVGNGTLIANPYSWNLLSNMIFIEAPAGVGFSYSDNRQDYEQVGDARTAQDNYKAILQWLNRFPEYANNTFYLTSESYGGHYIPTLAKVIVDSNPSASQKINFKGFAVGNPYTDPDSNDIGKFDTLWGHQLYSKPTRDEYDAVCPNTDPAKCAEIHAKIELEVGKVDPYGLDYPVCSRSTGRKQRYWFMNWLRYGKDNPTALKDAVLNYDPCSTEHVEGYLNERDVMTAIHANDTYWSECSPVITLFYNHSDSSVPMEPIYQYLINGGYNLRIMVYSGDDDTVCATLGTQMWIYNLGYDVKSSWREWSYDQQVGGYVTKFTGNLSFVTVHGAGHEVPAYKPDLALELWKNYLDGTWF